MQSLETPPRSVEPPHPKDTPAGGTSAPRDRPPGVRHRVLVAYGTRFGNTRRVAEALAKGLRSVPGVEVECLHVDDVPLQDLRRYDLFVIGGPTEILSASGSVKKFLARLPPTDLVGKRGFAFDTRLEGRITGSAGRYIEKHLAKAGVTIVRPHLSALVRGMTKEEQALHGDEGAPDWARKLEKPGPLAAASPSPPLDLLLTGFEVEFERIGAELGATLATVPAGG